MATRHVHLVRHAEPDDDGLLSERGLRQAELLGRRLADVPFTTVTHGPSPRARRTAEVVRSRSHVPAPVRELDAAGDYVPHLPTDSEVDVASRDRVRAFLAGVGADEAAHGARCAAEALRLFTGPEPGGQDTHHLVVTHAFTVGWLVRDALGAPPWRWVGIDVAHAGLTVIRHHPDRPAVVAVLNDMTHLPPPLRWTGFPAAVHV